MSLADTHLRQVLAAMVGPASSPREDQTAAVAALVEQQVRVLVVQAAVCVTCVMRTCLHRSSESRKWLD